MDDMGEEQRGRRERRNERRHTRPWRGWDRRVVTPALLGGLSMLIPGTDLVAGERSPHLTGGREPPERDARSGSRPLAGKAFYVPSYGPAERQIRDWRSTRPEDARLLERIVSQPSGSWFGDWNRDVRADVEGLVSEAAGAGAVPLLVAYNIPNRDCNQYSAGGVGSAEEYRSWIRELAAGIGDRDAIVVLEPDALAMVSCLTPEGQGERFTLIREAVEVLKTETGARVYVDAGHADWVPAEEMARRLHLAGIDRADGFALNVSNFISTEKNTAYGEEVAGRLGGAHFVIDTSRNGGTVAHGEWCNPAGAALGTSPTAETGHPQVDALLWIKRPGESDGACNGGPDAGRWWGEYALGLARGDTRV